MTEKGKCFKEAGLLINYSRISLAIPFEEINRYYIDIKSILCTSACT